MLNRFNPAGPLGGEAEVRYADGDYKVVRQGTFVRCAVTGVPIPLEDLNVLERRAPGAYASTTAGDRAVQARPRGLIVT